MKKICIITLFFVSTFTFAGTQKLISNYPEINKLFGKLEKLSDNAIPKLIKFRVEDNLTCRLPDGMVCSVFRSEHVAYQLSHYAFEYNRYVRASIDSRLYLTQLNELIGVSDYLVCQNISYGQYQEEYETYYYALDDSYSMRLLEVIER